MLVQQLQITTNSAKKEEKRKTGFYVYILTYLYAFDPVWIRRRDNI